MGGGKGKEVVPPGYERVFVEDLGQELLMDKDGNLFDFAGKLIGQADDADGEADANSKGSNDNHYFDDNSEQEPDHTAPQFPKPGQLPLPPLNPKKPGSL